MDINGNEESLILEGRLMRNGSGVLSMGMGFGGGLKVLIVVRFVDFFFLMYVELILVFIILF